MTKVRITIQTCYSTWSDPDTNRLYEAVGREVHARGVLRASRTYSITLLSRTTDSSGREGERSTTVREEVVRGISREEGRVACGSRAEIDSAQSAQYTSTT